MYFKFKCPHCKKSLRVREESSGKKLGCPYCQGSLRIPQIAAGSSLSLPSGDGLPDIDLNAAANRPGAKGVTPTKSTSSASTSQGRWTDACNVSLTLSGAIGLAVAVVFLTLLFPLRSFPIGALFWDRGWVPFVLTLLMFWSFAILGLKWRKYSRQKASMLLDVLPTDISQEITVETLDQFGKHIQGLPGEPGESFLLIRVMRGLEHFRVRKSAAETVTMMASQAEIDANNVASSYSLLKVFIWALPILGFIGTVIGVSAAVASLAGSLENASDISAVKGALNDVFGGLGTAFDTTLLALIMSMMVKIPASAMQKAEEDLVTQVDEYCNENLLRRLNDGREGGAERGAGGSGGIDRTTFRDAVEQAMTAHHAELERWMKKLADMAAQSESMQTEATASVKGTTQQLEVQFAGLQRGLEQLSGVLEKLGEQQVVVQQVERKRGWFSRTRNGR